MPIHDWTRVFAGSFHDFHCSWITHLKETLNDGLLPDEYYALAEQHTGDVVPDVLTLTHRRDGEDEHPLSGGMLLAEAPPKVAIHMVPGEDVAYRTLRRTIVIRHRTGRDIVAMIEIVSPGNKSSYRALDQFVEKFVSAIRQGIHLLVIDLHPPTSQDPQGIHGAIWEVIGGEFTFPDKRNLTLAAYRAERPLPEAFVEPVALGARMPEMPLFLDQDHYVETPLEATYSAAYQRLPKYLRDVLEGYLPPESESP